MLNLLSLMLAAGAPNATAPSFEADLASYAAVLRAHAEGAQIYECKAGQEGALTWTFREPIASLFVDGKTVGRHYVGPHWALDDGSVVQGKVVSTAPGATSADIALVKLAVIDHTGEGVLSPVTLVYRLNTRGGGLSGACAAAGTLRSVSYSADYVFVK